MSSKQQGLTADHFSSLADEYERMAGALTRSFADRVLALMPPINSSSIIHDEGCGPAIVAGVIMQQHKADPPSIVCTDFAEGMVKVSEAIGVREGWGSRVTYEQRDAADLHGLADQTFTHTIGQFMLFAVPDTKAALREAYRTTKPGGSVAYTTWKHAETMRILHRVQKAIRPDLPLWMANADFATEGDEDGSKDIARYRAWGEEIFGEGNCHVHKLPQVWSTTPDELVETYRSRFWDPIKKDWTEEEKAKWDDAVRDAILPKDKEGNGITMDAWCLVVQKK